MPIPPRDPPMNASADPSALEASGPLELVVVERTFEAPVDFEAVQRTEERVAWCLEQHGVRYVGSLLSRDRRRMVCLYHAPDAEAVRAVNRVSGVPADRVWTASAYGLLAEARTPAGQSVLPFDSLRTEDEQSP